MKAGFFLQIFSACHKPLSSLFHGQKASRDGGGELISLHSTWSVIRTHKQNNESLSVVDMSATSAEIKYL